MAQSAETGCIQILTYIKRRPTLTPAQFYHHWEDVHAPKVIPWAEKHGIRRYQQIHVSGKMVPSSATDSAPNAVSKGDLPSGPVEYDGIAMFTVPSLPQFKAAFEDPYYIDVIEPDEREFLDKEGPGSGIVASFNGKLLDLVNANKSTIGDKGGNYRDAFNEFERKAKA